MITPFKVTQKLKANKATDPIGLVSELFKPGVAGHDVVKSVLKLSNMIKEECRIPEFMEMTNITSLYKNKGSRQDLDNDRGIFTVTCLRSMVDKLIYNDYYDIIDSNMSDSNVGGRHNRSIRDNLFILYGVMNNALNNNINLDVTLYDIEKCFDSQWYEETMNDLWEVGVNDDKFAVIAEVNKKCNISVKTPVGQTDRFMLTNIEMQGTVMGPIKASVQLDTLGRDCYARQEGLYLYNECVSIPPLQMIDDVASFAICGSTQAIVTNAIVNAKMDSKKLTLGPKKCFNIHVGKNQECKDNLKVHDSPILQKEFETYIGDVICSSGANKKNIENRTNRGIGAVSEIISTLNQVSLGHYHFEIALVFRDSLLNSKLVYSAEVWYNITNSEYKKLEEIDEMYFRKIFDLPKSAPRVALYAECGKMPIRYIIKTRRLLFYWHILHLEEKELLHKFYLAQKFKPGKNDWILTILKDMEEIGLQMSEAEVKNSTLEKFKDIILSKIKMYVNTSLVKQLGSKTENLKFKILTPASYLSSKTLNREETQTLFKLRTKTINVKMNQESSYKNNPWCRACKLFSESQEHLCECPEVRKRLCNIELSDIKFEMIHGKQSDQEKFAKTYHIILKAWEDIIKKNESPSTEEDPCTSTDVGMRQLVPCILTVGI